MIMVSLWANRGRELLHDIAPQQLLVALDRLQSQHLAAGDPSALFDDLLEDLLTLTNSSNAVLAEVAPGPDGQPDLGRRHGVETAEMRAILREVLATRQPVFISLTPLADESRHRTVAYDYLGLPLTHEGGLAGVVVLADRPGGYDEELAEFLRPLLLMATAVLHAQEQHRRFHQRGEQLRYTEQQVRALLDTQERLQQMVEERTALLTQEVRLRLQLEHQSTATLKALEERRELEGRIQEAQRCESLAVLAGGVAHEFNNLLTSILGFADLTLSQLHPQSPLSGFVEQIVRASQRAAQLTRQMLAYSGQGRFVVQPISLQDYLRDQLPAFRAALSRHCLLRDELGTARLTVLADSSQLRQLVLNLLVNASEAIGERGGTVTLRCGVWEGGGSGDGPGEDTLAEGRYGFVEIEDDGGGMSEEVRARIFEPFYSTKFAGRGLGLPAVHGIVRGHRGALRVWTMPGMGSRFRVLLPLEDAPAAPVPLLRQELTLRTGTLLVIDDEVEVRTLVGRILERYQWTVLAAANGREAVELYRKHADTIDVVLLDLVMPTMSGAEVLQELRRVRSEMRLVLMSGHGLRPSMVGLKVADFLLKPFRAEHLIESLARALALA